MTHILTSNKVQQGTTGSLRTVRGNLIILQGLPVTMGVLKPLCPRYDLPLLELELSLLIGPLEIGVIPLMWTEAIVSG